MPCCNRLEQTGPSKLKTLLHHPRSSKHSRVKKPRALPQRSAHLPASYREVLTVGFHEDMELEEIARVVDSPLSTVKSRLYRGLAMLREWLKDIYA